MRKHYVTFQSPGTFFAEQTAKEIESWDPREAARMARSVTERYGATPYAFVFTTVLTHAPVPDGEGGTLDVMPREVARSGRFFLTGRVCREEDFPGPEHEILRSNMRNNDWPLVVECRRSFRSVQPFEEGDVLVDEDGKEVARGDDPGYVRYRARKLAERAAERAAS